MGSEYLAYRYFLVSEDQLSLFPKTKKDIINKLKYLLKNDKKISSKHRDRKYLLYFKKEISSSIFICKLARERHYEKHNEGEEDIETEEDIEFPFVYTIIDFNRQIILIQKNTSVFQEIDTPKNVLTTVINNAVDFGPYIFSIDEITYKQKFWRIVNESEEIYNFKLNLKSPNLFGARFEANEFLEKQKELHNASEMDVEYKNEHGKLKVLKKVFESFIDYISAGAGNYFIKYKSEGKVKETKSSDNIKKVYLSEEPQVENPENIKSELEKTDDIEG